MTNPMPLDIGRASIAIRKKKTSSRGRVGRRLLLEIHKREEKKKVSAYERTIIIPHLLLFFKERN